MRSTSHDVSSTAQIVDLDAAREARLAPLQTLDAFSAVLEAIGDLPTGADRDAAYDRIADRLQAIVPWDTFAILVLDDAGEELTFRYARGLPEEVTSRWRFGLGQGLVGCAAESGGGQCSNPACTRGRQLEEDVATGTGSARVYDGEGPILLPGLRSEIAVPLRGRRRTMGVLDLGSKAEDAFGPEHLHVLELLAHHLGRNIESSCAHDQAQRLARSLSVLQEASRELTSILDRERLLQRIAEIVGGLIDVQLFSVMLWDDEREHLETVFTHRTADNTSRKLTLRLGEGLCGTAAVTRRPVRVGNVADDPRWVHCGEDRVRSELVLPLVIEDRLLGVLDLESFRLDAFSADHEQMLQTLAANVAVALDNADLYERLQRDEQRLARDLSTAREVQRFLLPRRSPWVPGLQVGAVNEPARDLGGDVYDFYAYGEGRTAFAIGDVAGKGTGAALYGSLTLGLLRGYANDNLCGPGCVMTYLDDELRQLDVENRFLALTFAVYDSRQHTLRLANAGLPYPWLVRDGKAEEITLGGIPLGAMSGGKSGGRVVREEREIQLQPGDFVVFTTDGVDESRDPADQAFGDAGVRRLLERRAASDRTAADLAQAVVDATDRHLASRAAQDDRTVLVLKVTH